MSNRHNTPNAADAALDLFSKAASERDAGIARADLSIQQNDEAEQIVQRVTDMLMRQLHDSGRNQFTSDDVGALLDRLNVAPDLTTRRRYASAIVNRGVGKSWRKVGYTPSVRRHCSPIALWQLT